MKRLTSNPWIVCMSAASIFFYQFIQISCFNALNTHFTLAFDLSSSKIGFLSALFFYGTVLLLIPAGVIIDRFSTRRLILSAMLITLVAEIIFLLAPSFLFIAIARFLMGISIGPVCFVASMRLASRWFSAERFALVMGIIVSYGMLGGIVAQTPVITLADKYGWQGAMLANLGLGAFITLIMYLFVYDYPLDKETEYQSQKNDHQKLGLKKSLKQSILKLQNWYCGIFASMLNLPIFLLGSLWGNVYLTQVFGLTGIEASVVTSMLFLGLLFGSPAFGFFSDLIKVRKIPMLIGSLLTTSTMIFVIENHSLTLPALTILFFILGFGSGAQVLAYPTLAESNPMSLTATAQGLSSTLVMLGGAIFQPLLSWLIELKWDGTGEAGIPLYSPENYKFGMWLLPISMFISGLIVILMRETNCKRQDFAMPIMQAPKEILVKQPYTDVAKKLK